MKRSQETQAETVGKAPSKGLRAGTRTCDRWRTTVDSVLLRMFHHVTWFSSINVPICPIFKCNFSWNIFYNFFHKFDIISWGFQWNVYNIFWLKEHIAAVHAAINVAHFRGWSQTLHSTLPPPLLRSVTLWELVKTLCANHLYAQVWSWVALNMESSRSLLWLGSVMLKHPENLKYFLN